MVKNTGKAYEEFVGTIQQSLINAEGISHLKNIKVETNKIIKDRNGIDRQFDVYWEFNIGGHEYKTVIECKDYASTITVDKIDAFLGKTDDIPGLRLIYATKTGYQSGAKIKAENNKIDLLIVREANDSDWMAPDGTPLIKQLQINVTAITPPVIKYFTPSIEQSWLDSQKDLDVDTIIQKLSSIPSNELFIKNCTNGDFYSLYKLSSILTVKIPDIKYGEGTFREKLNDNSYLQSENGDFQIKISGYELGYEYHEPITFISTIDYSKDLLGIVQNYLSGSKQMIFKDGRTK